MWAVRWADGPYEETVIDSHPCWKLPKRDGATYFYVNVDDDFAKEGDYALQEDYLDKGSGSLIKTWLALSKQET